MSQVATRIIAIIASYLKLDPENIDPATFPMVFTAEDCSDTIASAEQLLEIEEEFELMITDEEAARFHSLADVIDYVEEHIS